MDLVILKEGKRLKALVIQNESIIFYDDSYSERSLKLKLLDAGCSFSDDVWDRAIEKSDVVLEETT